MEGGDRLGESGAGRPAGQVVVVGPAPNDPGDAGQDGVGQAQVVVALGPDGGVADGAADPDGVGQRHQQGRKREEQGRARGGPPSPRLRAGLARFACARAEQQVERAHRHEQRRLRPGEQRQAGGPPRADRGAGVRWSARGAEQERHAGQAEQRERGLGHHLRRYVQEDRVPGDEERGQQAEARGPKAPGQDEQRQGQEPPGQGRDDAGRALHRRRRVHRRPAGEPEPREGMRHPGDQPGIERGPGGMKAVRARVAEQILREARVERAIRLDDPGLRDERQPDCDRRERQDEQRREHAVRVGVLPPPVTSGLLFFGSVHRIPALYVFRESV